MSTHLGFAQFFPFPKSGFDAVAKALRRRKQWFTTIPTSFEQHCLLFKGLGLSVELCLNGDMDDKPYSEVFVYATEDGDLRRAAAVLGIVQKTCGLAVFWTLYWSRWCDAPRVGHFHGGHVTVHEGKVLREHSPVKLRRTRSGTVAEFER